MRNFTFILMSASLMVSVPATATVRDLFGKAHNVIGHSHKKAPAHKSFSEIKERMQRTPEENMIYRASTEKAFAWDGVDWELSETYSKEYDEAGRLVSEIVVDNYEGFHIRTSYTYNANGMEISELVEVSEDGETYVNSEKTEREYDPIVTDVIIKNRPYIWIDGEWQPSGNNYNRNITRNADGNVTMVEIAVWFDGKYDPTERMEITYGDDAKATTIKQSVLTYDGVNYEWEDALTISNIVWDRTDGQIVNIDGIGIGANRVKSCDQSEGEDDLHAEFTYDGNNFAAIITGTVDGEMMEGTSVYEQLDDYGSCKGTASYTYKPEGEEPYTEVEIYTLRYDAYGNLLESKDVAIYDGFEEIYEDVTGTVEYDETYGYPLTYVVSEGYYDPDTDEYVKENMLKVEFADYIGIVSGVENVKATDSTAEDAYYTLQGMKVSNPAPGNVYIRIQGGKASKVIIK